MVKHGYFICQDFYDQSMSVPEGRMPVRRRLEDIPEDNGIDEMAELTFSELGERCAKFSEVCREQYRLQEAEIFKQLAQYYNSKSGQTSLVFQELTELLNKIATTQREKEELFYAVLEKIKK